MTMNTNTGQSNGLTMDVQSLQTLKAAAARDPHAAIKETAKQLEGVFMQQLMKSMRASTMKSGMFNDKTAEMGTNMLDAEMANKMTGLPRGLGELIAKQLERQMGTSSSSSSPAAAAAGSGAAATSKATLGTLALRNSTQLQTLAMMDANGGVSDTTAATSPAPGDASDASPMGLRTSMSLSSAVLSNASPSTAVHALLTPADAILGASGPAVSAWSRQAAQAAYGAYSAYSADSAPAALSASPPSASEASGASAANWNTHIDATTASALSASASHSHSQAERFIQQHQSDALAAQAATGIPASNILGQAGLETGWGRHEIRMKDGTPSHNLFGIKATSDWKGKVAEVTTTEYANGVPKRVTARFRAYDSYADAFKDHARLLTQNPRYSQTVAKADTAQGFASGLQRAGYATDPAYAAKLTKAINTTLRLQRSQA